MYKYQDKEMSGNGQDNQLSDLSFFLPKTSQSRTLTITPLWLTHRFLE